MNIMIVDDERVQIESVRRGLRSKGYHILEALNAEEALQKLNGDNPKVDIVLTDYAMPGMNGMDLLKKIRRKNKCLPVIMMTAYGEKDLVIDALRNRCNSFIEKPFTLDQLVKEIKRAEINIFQNAGSHQLGDLFPKLVHQINNPLMSIMGCAELCMLHMGDPEKLKNSLSGILEATEKIQEINSKIMNLGQGGEDKIETVDIKALLEHCLKTFQDLMGLKGVTLRTELGNGDLKISGNVFSLEQLFKNLLLNAIDAMNGMNDKILTVKAFSEIEGSVMSVFIEDTGCGIPEDSMEEIFVPYFTGKENGTGLGLAVARDVVYKHGGKIEMESGLSKGTVFKITLPKHSFPSREGKGTGINDDIE